jgi:hypothetical protein
MDYYFNDFTEKNYRKLLLLAQKRFEFVQYNQVFADSEKFEIIWRHDVDFSIHRALALARIEHELKIKSTFFIQLGSTCYNCFEEEIKEKVEEIMSLGHSIGLHFYAQFYNVQTKYELEERLYFEKYILETILNQKIDVFSFHNPSIEILDRFTEARYTGLINTYSDFFRKNFGYCSDSNGYWRHERMKDFLLNKNNKRIQVLTHPEWWQKKAISPQDRIWRSIEGRASNTKKWYLDMINKTNRINVE